MSAWWRTFVLVVIVLDIPLLARLVERLTSKPRVEQLEIDGVPVEILRAPDTRARPAWVFVNGAHPERRREPVVTRLANGLARAGFVAVVPDVPGLGEGTITSRTVSATAAVVRAVGDRDDVRSGRVALIGASTGAGLGLVVAARDDLAARVSVVAAVAPYADLRKLVCLTTTNSYAQNGRFARYEVTPLHRHVVASSLVGALSDAAERDRLVGEVQLIEEQGLDPLDELPRRAGAVGAEAQAVLSLLANRDPARFDTLYEALPASVHDLIGQLSPLACAAQVRAPVEVVVPPLDAYFPLGEAESLAASLPNVRLTVTPTLDHTRPSIAQLRGFRRFLGFVVRGLRTAS